MRDTNRVYNGEVRVFCTAVQERETQTVYNGEVCVFCTAVQDRETQTTEIKRREEEILEQEQQNVAAPAGTRSWLWTSLHCRSERS